MRRRSSRKSHILPAHSPLSRATDPRAIFAPQSRYTPRELYSVVANVPSYSAFVPFCTGSEIVSTLTSNISADTPFDVEAELRIGFMNFSEGYVSKVKARPYDSVEVSPFIWKEGVGTRHRRRAQKSALADLCLVG